MGKTKKGIEEDSSLPQIINIKPTQGSYTNQTMQDQNQRRKQSNDEYFPSGNNQPPWASLAANKLNRTVRMNYSSLRKFTEMPNDRLQNEQLEPDSLRDYSKSFNIGIKPKKLRKIEIVNLNESIRQIQQSPPKSRKKSKNIDHSIKKSEFMVLYEHWKKQQKPNNSKSSRKLLQQQQQQ